MLTAAEAVRQVSTGGARVASVVADVSTESGVQSVVDATMAAFGRIDITVNNVGVGRGGDLEATTDADWREAFDHTLFPAIRLSRLALPHLRKQGGAILIVSSIFGRAGARPGSTRCGTTGATSTSA